ncbi:AAA family ATPase [Dactylosporangium sp. NPDC050688]|uniref:helix-turn-helix transcriptional regulator n=1 Tax=Dactylosporangium sp. NPDC050688 TaxID=3157217 RepID=UPI0033D54E7E
MQRGVRVALRGRSEALRRILQVMAEVSDQGDAHMVVVTGEPGIGKSAFLAEVEDHAAQLGYAIGSAKAEEFDQIAPGITMLAALQYGTPPLLSAADITSLFELREQRFWLVEQLAAILETRATGSPLLLAIDDVQWIDPLSRFGLRVLPARLRGSPVLFVLGSRPDDAVREIAAAAGRVVPVEDVRLGPLSAGDIDQVVEDILGRPADTRERALLQGAGGNPFLAVEMLRGIRAAGTLPAGAPPASIMLGVRGQLRALPASTLRFLQVGAVLGRRFTLADAAALRHTSTTALLDDLAAGVGSVLVDDGEQIAFRHDIVRQAVYADVPASARKALHREAAQRLMAMGRKPIDAAQHVLLGAAPGDTAAVRLLRRAASDVREMMPGLAADLMLRALDLSDPADPVHLELSEDAIRLLSAAHRSQEALDFGDRMLALYPRPVEQGCLTADLARPLWNLGMVAELRRRVDEALDAGGFSEQIAARLAAVRALALSRGTDLAEARVDGDAALQQARRAGDTAAEATAVWALGETALNAGFCRQALDRFVELRSLDPSFRAEEILALLHLDDFEGAGRRLAEARQHPELGDGQPKIAALTWAQGLYDMGLGRLDDAEADFTSVTELDTELQERSHDVGCKAMLTWIASLRGDAAAARSWFAAARADLAVWPTPGDTAFVGFIEAWLALRDGDAGAAVRVLRREGFADNLMRWRILRALVVWAVRIALDGGDRELAASLAEQAEVYASRNPALVTAGALAAHATALVRGDADLLAHATEALREAPRRLAYADAAADYGQALLRRRRGVDGVTLLSQSLDAYAAAGAAGEVRRVEQLLRAAGIRRQVRAQERPVQGWDALTATERRVARLIADCHTNRSAAAQLSISPHTVNTHLGSVFRKLGVTSRVQLARLVLSEEARG